MTNFSISAMVKAQLSQTWGNVISHEFAISNRLAEKYGPVDRNGCRVPDDILQRDLNAAVGSAGAYLNSGRAIGCIPSLQPASVCLTLGAQVVSVPLGGSVAVPRGTSGVSTTWLANETSTITESQPLFGQVVATPKMLSCFAEVSRQLLLQSNADEILRQEFQRAAATALDAAILGGSGASGQPQGIATTSGVGTFTGASLSQSALRNAQADVNGATGVNPATLGYVTTPAVAEILAARQRFTGSDRGLWEGASADGIVEGVRAMATTACPTAVMIHGDFSRVHVVQWLDGLVIEADPFSKFASGVVALRLLLPVDFIVAQAAAFSVATSVT